MPFIVATYVYASSQGQRTHSARTNCKITFLNIKSRQDKLGETSKSSRAINGFDTTVYLPLTKVGICSIFNLNIKESKKLRIFVSELRQNRENKCPKVSLEGGPHLH